MQPLHSMRPYNFLGLAGQEYKKAKTIVVPVPSDCAASVKPGQRFGPHAIITASRDLNPFDEELGYSATENGVYTLDEVAPARGDIVETTRRVKQVVGDVLADKKFPVVLGGDHSVSIGALQAFADNGSFSVLYLDAHADLFDEYEGTKHSHACVARRAMESGVKVVQLGVRDVAEEEKNVNPDLFLLRETRKDFAAKVGKAIKRLSGRVYVSIDVDALDPGIMPSTGIPEPGGMTWGEMMFVLKKVAEEKEVVGFDVVELMPIPGLDAPNLLAARLVHKFLGYVFND